MCESVRLRLFDVLVEVIQQEEGVDWKEAFKMCCERLELEVIRDNDPRNDFSELKDEYLSGPFSTGTTACGRSASYALQAA